MLQKLREQDTNKNTENFYLFFETQTRNLHWILGLGSAKLTDTNIYI